jgi:hypothetical protein
MMRSLINRFAAGLSGLFILSSCATTNGGISGIRPVGGLAVGQTSVAAGNELVSRGQYGLAIAAYRRVLRLDPASSAAREGLAISYELLGRLDLSDRYYQEALALAPRNPRIYENFAASLRAQGRQGDADRLMADMRIALPGEPVQTAVAAVPVQDSAKTAAVAEVRTVQAVPSAEPDVRTIQISDRSSLVLTMPRQPVAAPVVAKAARAVRVVNAVGRQGIARQTVALLAKRGIEGLEVGDATFKLKRSRILVPQRQRAQGEQLSRNLPFAVRIEESAVAGRVQLLVGEDALPALRRARRA